MPTEARKLKISIGKSGGNSGSGTKKHLLSLPNTWMQAMGITSDERTVAVSFDGDQITIKKSDGE